MATISWQIPRNCLAWLLTAQLVLLIPHIERLPWWVMLVYLCCALWRIMIYQGRWSLPPKYLKALMAVLCFIGIYQNYGRMVGLEPTVALLFTGFSLKLLEISSRRDAYLLTFLAYFVATTAFLFSQELLLAVYVFFSLFIITTALVALHQHELAAFNFVSLGKTATIFAQAVPLMVVLFLVFPRFDPLWSVPLPSHQAKTGMSDTMSPGDVAKLGRSAELAFRVIFTGETPPKSQLYWRGLVLSTFDGRVWSQSRETVRLLSERESFRIRQRFDQPLSYSVIMEPSYQRWVFALPLAYSAHASLKMVSDSRLLNIDPIRTRFQFDVLTDTGARLEEDLTQAQLQSYTALPDNSSPLARSFAQQLLLESRDTQDLIDRVLQYFTQQPFYYTLQPPLLGEHPVDEFLFTTRRGFCEHYSSSFVVLMRAAGIPARVVTGYQGGEVSPLTGTVSVRQYDAHAWAEVWIAGKGWTRVDPTAAVSPARIEFGLEQALQQSQEQFLADSPLSPLRYRNIDLINQLLLQMEAINYRWVVWVLNYQGQQQIDVLKNILGEVTAARVAIFILVVGALVFAVVLWQFNRGRAAIKPEQRQYLRLCDALARAGFVREAHEGPIDFARRLAEQQPEWKTGLLSATRTFVTLSYASLSEQQRRLLYKQLRGEVIKLRYRLRVIYRH